MRQGLAILAIGSRPIILNMVDLVLGRKIYEELEVR
jgi:hypothetical protein